MSLPRYPSYTALAMPEDRDFPQPAIDRPRRGTDRALSVALALTVLAVPLAIWDGVIDYNLGKTAVFLVLLPFLTVLWGLTVSTNGRRTIRLPWILIPFALFALAALLSLVHAVNRPEVVQALLISLLFVQLMMIALHVGRTERDAQLLVGSLLLAGTVAGAIALLQYTGILGTRLGQTGPSAITSTFGNRNYLGSFLACVFFPSAVFVLQSGSAIRRVTAAVLLAFVLVIVILIDQMATPFALLAASGVGIALALLTRAKRRRLPKGLLPLFLFVAVVATIVIAVRIGLRTKADQDRSALQHLLEENSIDSRLLFWSVGWEMLADHPITGIGFGNYRMLYTSYEAAVRSSRGSHSSSEVRTRTEVAHNDYIQVAAELGMGGILAMLAFLAVLVWSIWIRLMASRGPPSYTTWILLLTAGIVVLLAHALVSFPVHLPSSALAATVLLALLLSPLTGERGVSRVVVSRRQWQAILVGMVLLASVGAVLAVGEVAGHALMQRGAAQLSSGDPYAARETLTRSVRMRFCPRCSVYYLATAQAQSELYDEALISFERCLHCCPADRAYLFYADLAAQLGEIEAAREAIDTLLATVPSDDLRIRAEVVRKQIDRLADPESPPSSSPDN